MDTVAERYKAYRTSWLGELEDLFAYIGYRFGRREMREVSVQPIHLSSVVKAE